MLEVESLVPGLPHLNPHSHPPPRREDAPLCPRVLVLFSVLQLGTHSQKQHQVNDCS